jgi:hypothetical protein
LTEALIGEETEITVDEELVIQRAPRFLCDHVREERKRNCPLFRSIDSLIWFRRGRSVLSADDFNRGPPIVGLRTTIPIASAAQRRARSTNRAEPRKTRRPIVAIRMARHPKPGRCRRARCIA